MGFKNNISKPVIIIAALGYSGSLFGQISTYNDESLTNRFYSDSGQWIRVSNANCVVWNSMPTKGESVVWSGGVLNGKAHGNGIQQWYVDGKPTLTYEGGVSNGLYEGHGIVKKFGYSFEGEWSMGRLISKTTMICYPSGGWYKGEQKDGFKEGFGEEMMKGGQKYTGQFKRDRFCGHGELILPNSDKIVGEWKDSKLTGIGEYRPKIGEPFKVKMTERGIERAPDTQ